MVLEQEIIEQKKVACMLIFTVLTVQQLPAAVVPKQLSLRLHHPVLHLWQAGPWLWSALPLVAEPSLLPPLNPGGPVDKHGDSSVYGSPPNIESPPHRSITVQITLDNHQCWGNSVIKRNLTSFNSELVLFPRLYCMIKEWCAAKFSGLNSEWSLNSNVVLTPGATVLISTLPLLSYMLNSWTFIVQFLAWSRPDTID